MAVSHLILSYPNINNRFVFKTLAFSCKQYTQHHTYLNTGIRMRKMYIIIILQFGNDSSIDAAGGAAVYKYFEIIWLDYSYVRVQATTIR